MAITIKQVPTKFKVRSRTLHVFGYMCLWYIYIYIYNLLWLILQPKGFFKFQPFRSFILMTSLITVHTCSPHLPLPSDSTTLLKRTSFYVHLSCGKCVCQWVLVRLFCACVSRPQHEARLTTFSWKWKIPAPYSRNSFRLSLLSFSSLQHHVGFL